MLLAWKEIKRNKLRYVLISTIIIAILFLVFFITALSSGLGYADTAAISNLKAKRVVLNKEAEGVLIKSVLKSKDIEEINKQLNVKSSPFNVTNSTLEKEGERSVDIAYFTIDQSQYGPLDIVEGKNLDQLKDEEVIADESLKRHGYSLNDTIKDSRTGKIMKIAGFTEGQIYSHMPVIFTDLHLGFQSLYAGTEVYNAVLVNSDKVEVSGYDVKIVEDIVKTIPGHKETQTSFSVMKTFLIIISVFVSSVFFYVLTIQKLNQFGVLKALGMKTIDIAKSIITQVIFLTCIGLVISGFGFYGIIQVLPEEIPFKLSMDSMVKTGTLFLVLNSFGALLSIWKVTKIDPLEAIGRVE